MISIKQFDDATIERLFGADDAENERDDRFKEYFYYNKVFENINNDLPIRLLVGHKGIGKSALLKRAYINDREQHRLAIQLRPGDIIDFARSPGAVEFNKLVEQWKAGLLSAIATNAITNYMADDAAKSQLPQFGAKISQFLPLLATLLAKGAKKLTDKTDRAIVETFAKDNAIHVYIDDIDRGWAASEADIKNISALLNAVRDISGSDQRIRFRIGLRTDVYYLVRTSDESTDKIERHVVWLNWTNHEILSIIAKRITTFFGETIDQNRNSKANPNSNLGAHLIKGD